MKKGLAVLLLFLLPLIAFSEDLKNNPFVKEMAPKIKTKTEIKVYKFKVKEGNFIHPQKLTKKQAMKILHCIKLDRKPYPLILSHEDILKILPDFLKAMAEAKPDEKVVIEKTKHYINSKEKKDIHKKVDQLYFSLPDENHLLVNYLYEGYKRGRTLLTSKYIKYYSKDGNVYKNSVLIDKKVWTTRLNFAEFDSIYEETFEKLPKNPDAEINPNNKNELVKKQENQIPQNTISTEEMEKELQRLKNMLDKKLITEEEFMKLKQKVLKKAGL